MHLKLERMDDSGKYLLYIDDIKFATCFHVATAFFPVAARETKQITPLVMQFGVSVDMSPAGVVICKIQNRKIKLNL